MRSLFCVFASIAVAVAASAETKVGIIGLDTSHAIAFTKIMNVDKDPGVEGFCVTAAYQWGSKDIFSSTNRYPKYIAEVREMGVAIVPTIDELLDKVDVVCLETNDGREHLWQAEKVFKSGKPVFIDKPIAHNLTDALKIYELGKKYRAKYFSASALRFSKVAQDARAGRYGEIRGTDIIAPSPYEPSHNYYSWYGIHGFEPLVTIMGVGAEKVTCLRNEANDVITVLWKDGRMGQIRLLREDAYRYSGYLLPENPKDETNPLIVYDGYPGCEPLLREIIKFFRTGVVPFPPDETLEIFALMEAAEMSARRGGEPVMLTEVIEECSDSPWWKFW